MEQQLVQAPLFPYHVQVDSTYNRQVVLLVDLTLILVVQWFPQSNVILDIQLHRPLA